LFLKGFFLVLSWVNDYSFIGEISGDSKDKLTGFKSLVD
jgi:hypothetical protein